MPPSSPFDSDDGSDAAETRPDPLVARRRRFARTRRRALVGGMLALLVLVWLRELLGLPDGPIWLVSLVVIAFLLIVCVRASETTHQYLVGLRRQRVRERRLRQAVTQSETLRFEAWKSRDHRCPECQGEMAVIKLIDGTAGRPLRYVGLDTRKRVGAEEPVLAGEVYGEVCRECSRIVFRGLPL